jgi:hypothetical protein
MKTLLILGGAALGVFLLTRKASAKTTPSGQPGTNITITPTGGWAYPPMTSGNFTSWCQSNNGVQLSPGKCAISGKGIYTLSNSRIKDPNNSWLLDDDDLF